MLGRPSEYTTETGKTVCELIIEGLSVREIAERDDMPSEKTIWTWISKYPEFLQGYTRAKETQADRFAEDIIEISDNGTNDWMDRRIEEGTIVRTADHEHINRSRLRVDARKWLMAKMAPKKYGEKVAVDHSGTVTLEQMVLQSYPKSE